MDLATLRSETEDLTVALGRTRLSAEAGVTAAPDLAGALRAHPDVVSPDALALVREARATAAGKGEEKRARRLAMLSGHLFQLAGLAAAPAARESLARAEATTTVRGVEPGELLSLRTAARELARVRGRDARAALEARLVVTLATADGARARAIEGFGEVAQRAGFAHAAAALEAFWGVDLHALAAEAAQFLSDTDGMYADVLAWWLRRTLEIKPFPHGAAWHDLAHAFGPPAFEGLFPRGEPSGVLARRVGAMGLDPSAVRLDVADLPGRRPAAFVAPLEVPSDVVVVMRPALGFDDAGAYLTALGTGLHLAGTDAARPFEDRHAGDPAVAAASGLLFGHWLTDRRWLRRMLDGDAPDLPRVAALRELLRARQAAAMVGHELSLHSEGLRAGLAERFEEALSRATGARMPPGLHLVGGEEPLSAVHALRAMALEASLFETLRDRFDEDWWTNPRTGPFLAKLHELGGFETADAIGERLGQGPLRLANVVRRLEVLLA